MEGKVLVNIGVQRFDRIREQNALYIDKTSMVKAWFGGSTETAYNNFIKALLINDADAMNGFMNKIALHSLEFKVHKPLKEKDLAQTVANALNQIEEKRYEAKLAADGFAPENIRKYGFAFQGKECMIGC